MSTNHFEVRFNIVCADTLDISCKSFIKPEIVPPPHCHQVAKPLRSSINTNNSNLQWQYAGKHVTLTQQHFNGNKCSKPWLYTLLQGVAT